MRRTLGRLLVAGAVALAAVSIVPAARAGTTAPYLSQPRSALQRGQSTTISGTYFTAGQSYVLTADHGLLGSAQTPSAVVDAGAGKLSFSVAFYLPSDITSTSVQVSASLSGDPTVLATITINVAPPTVGASGGCPGSSINVHGASFPDGTYTLDTDAGTLPSTQVTAANGMFDTLLTLPVTGSATVRVTDPQTTQILASGSTWFSWPHITYNGGGLWEQSYTATCFAPNESVAIAYPQHMSGPASVQADAAGTVKFSAAIHPVVQYTELQSLDVRGRSSAQQAFAQPQPIQGTTLSGGQQLAEDPPRMLISTLPGFAFQATYCGLVIEGYRPDGGSSSTWSWGWLPGRSVPGCKLTMQSDGNLVYRSPTGQAIWSTGTTGAGKGNRAVMRNDGTLAIVSADGSISWTNEIGRIRSAAGYTTQLSEAVPSGPGIRPLSYVGTVDRWGANGKLAHSARRAVYVQRVYGGRWHNVGLTLTDRLGRFKITLTTTAVGWYKVVVPAAGTAASTHSRPWRMT